MKKLHVITLLESFSVGLIALTLSACGGGDTTPVLETPGITIPTTNLVLLTDTIGEIKSPELVSAISLEFEEENISILISNNVDECCGEPAIAGTNIEGLTGPGDGISVVVPDDAEGTTHIGLNYFRGSNASTNEGSMTVLIDDVEVGSLIPVINSDDWATLANNGIPTVYLEVGALTAGQVVTLIVDDAFSAGNLDSIGFYNNENYQYLVAGNTANIEGMTLYTFDEDKVEGESACVDDCAAQWPPYTIPTLEHLVPFSSGNVSTITRTDGSLQVTINDEPLYFYAEDQFVGDMLGADINNWKIADLIPNGKPPELIALVKLGDEDAISEIIGNGISECCGPDPFLNEDGNLGGLDGPGDGFSVIVPEEASGLSVVGFTYYRGTDSSGSMSVLVDGVQVATLILHGNADSSWGAFLENAIPTAYVTLDVPLSAGQIVTLMTDNQFSAGVGISVGFYLPGTLEEEDVVIPPEEPEQENTLAAPHTYKAVVKLTFDSLPAENIVGNGIAECCGLADPVIQDDGTLNGFYGNGDIVTINVPAGAAGLNVIGLGLAVGDNGGAPLGVDVTVNGEDAGMIKPSRNSDDWVTTYDNVPNTFFLTLDAPLAEGDVISITPIGDFAAGVGLHFGFYIPTLLEFGFTELPAESFIGNDIDEGNCCGVTGPTILDNGFMGGYTGNGDIVQITVPSVAAGITTIGLGLAVGDNGGAPLGVDVTINGEDAGVILPSRNSDNWETTYASTPNTFFLTLDTPLVEGDVIALTPSGDFSAGTGLNFGFYGNTYAALTQFPFTALPAESFIGNDVDEGNCCGVTGPTILDNGLMGGFTGNGDIVQITVPAAAAGTSIVGLSLAVGDNGGGPLGVDVTVNGENTGVIIPVRNSDNWETTYFGSPSIFFLELSTPLAEGDVVTITPSGDFTAGTGLHFGFYE